MRNALHPIPWLNPFMFLRSPGSEQFRIHNPGRLLREHPPAALAAGSAVRLATGQSNEKISVPVPALGTDRRSFALDAAYRGDQVLHMRWGQGLLDQHQ